jgi:hypothetical protein
MSAKWKRGATRAAMLIVVLALAGCKPPHPPPVPGPIQPPSPPGTMAPAWTRTGSWIY